MSCARSVQKFGGKENNIKNNTKEQMGYEQPVTPFSYVYSRLPLGALPSSIKPKKPIHGLASCSLPPLFG